jgi:hypothetical protein
MRKIIAAFVAPVLVVVALVVGASTANAQPTGSIDIVLGEDGQLIGKGAVATVPMEVTCSILSGNFLFADTFASLRQVKGKTLVAAQGGVTLSSADCDGTPHTVNLTFFADAPWSPGVAVVNASITLGIVDPDTGEQSFVSDSQGLTEIRLKN